MVSPANRTILSSFLAALFVVVADGVLGISDSLPLGELLVGLLVFPGFTLLLPQVYFAWRSDDAAMVRRHVWAGCGLSALVVFGVATNTGPPERWGLLGVACALLAVPVGITAREQYRATVAGDE